MTARMVSGPPAYDRGQDDVGLGEEPGRRRDAGQGQQEQGHEDAEQRLALRPSPANVSSDDVTPRPLLERGDDRERAEVHERVGGAVVEQALEALDLPAGVGRQARRACSRCGRWSCRRASA